MSMKSKAKALASKVSKALTPILDLPFAERIPLFDTEYKALVAKYGVFHNPVNIYDDATVPGGVLKPNAPAEPTAEPTK